MLILEDYLDKLINECKVVYGERLVYLGLQGSYLRGEATDKSDIDIMAVIDDFCAADMDIYREILKKVGDYERSCGFICGRDELARWNPLEVIQLRYTTKDLYGTLAELLPEAQREDEVNYVKVSLGNLYHELCHRYIHTEKENSAVKLSFTLKGFFFLIQNLHYIESGEFLLNKKELKEKVSPEDRYILELSENYVTQDFEIVFPKVMEWCRQAFIRADI
ncbi:MAG: nucleotidyltransferase domain-containing protein [Ruminococcus sp.]|uniref:nucleotidyltransferase domain-containing protein n=1 Tax=Ruminococcus sp. TaxID=41978 RepID=UPI0025DC2F60|nr:nucleotidyltransferase domain-containing protein [Ruminococcus sp.]MCR5541745.1 nucleotidyltransferase domain-containing protein [Ruminococcus sp.]